VTQSARTPTRRVSTVQPQRPRRTRQRRTLT
jgi:hypothetical protein